jgi:hypothetical protein
MLILSSHNACSAQPSAIAPTAAAIAPTAAAIAPAAAATLHKSNLAFLHPWKRRWQYAVRAQL